MTIFENHIENGHYHCSIDNNDYHQECFEEDYISRQAAIKLKIYPFDRPTGKNDPIKIQFDLARNYFINVKECMTPKEIAYFCLI